MTQPKLYDERGKQLTSLSIDEALALMSKSDIQKLKHRWTQEAKDWAEKTDEEREVITTADEVVNQMKF
ncbi:hypothetical protein ABDK00_013205 [Niabella insulamsoli]|uniref:hypothetical protein n=1 Tax=Niabella insulamsoli TaxID=3144874 RepID=UPI0031FBD8B8